ncbi:MAG: 4-hydroxy-3-methylbut-2-enyl diphosphate reductase [Phycisphaerales bacterium]|nr:4-hydroxy-3-methylbut-2-enyl diphosphate reductase [Phycisphaerales bacterium]
MRQFDIPSFYKSDYINAIKNKRNATDKLKKDFTPTFFEKGGVHFYIARFFGFCYGVENAIEIACKVVDEYKNQNKKIYLLSEIIHNDFVNTMLYDQGIRFLYDTIGNSLIPLDTLDDHAVVIIPAFGTTVAVQNKIKERGALIKQYDATCPFVKKVWNKGEQLSAKGYTTIVHGKWHHEETKATFSQISQHTPVLVIENLKEAQLLASYIVTSNTNTDFYDYFNNRYSAHFDIKKDLNKIGVVNQTTQLASETKKIIAYLKDVMHKKFPHDPVADHFADTKDTLCYATNDNQNALIAMLDTPADLAIIIGGFKSSNTSHLVELCEEKLQTYYIDGADCIQDKSRIQHFSIHTKAVQESCNWLPAHKHPTILLSSGASTPDILVEEVIDKIVACIDQ